MIEQTDKLADKLAELEKEHKALALAVLEMLRTQKDFFRTKDAGTLTRSKTLESAMKRRCDSILTPPVQNLFQQE